MNQTLILAAMLDGAIKTSQSNINHPLSLSNYRNKLQDNLASKCFLPQGSRDGAVVRALVSHQCGLSSIPGVDAVCGLSLLLVFIPAPRNFSLGTPIFLPPQKPTFQIPIWPGNNGWKGHSVEANEIPIYFYNYKFFINNNNCVLWLFWLQTLCLDECQKEILFFDCEFGELFLFKQSARICGWVMLVTRASLLLFIEKYLLMIKNYMNINRHIWNLKGLC